MIALYIILAVLLLLTLLMFVKLWVYFEYTDTAKLVLKVLFLKITLVPHTDKPKKKKRKKPEKKETAKKKGKKPSALKKLTDKKGMSGLLEMLTDMSKLVSTTLKGLFSNVNITKFDVDVTIVGEDASDTALKYGKICGVFYSAVSIICSVTKCKGYNLNLTPDFDDEAQTKINCDIVAYIRVFYVVKYALKALLKILVIRYKK